MNFQEDSIILVDDCFKNQHQTSLAWRNLRYEVNTRWWLPFFPLHKVILRRLNGKIRYHQLNAILGPSGAGKTTLLKCLNGTLKKGLDQQTEIYLNRDQQKCPDIRFVGQHVHELIMGKMKIRHVLSYAYLFNNGCCRNLHLMDNHINKVLNELLLDQSILDRTFEQCSGGEQKRVAIAQELMSLEKPSFLFLDEPTTGLDSNSAYLVMKCLHHLVDIHRMTVLVNIHQPNQDIMNLIDHVYILAKGGVCIYSGEPKLLRENLKTQLEIDRFDEKKPPIEEYLKVACEGINNEVVRKLANKTLIEEYEQASSCLNYMEFQSTGIPIRYKLFTITDFVIQLVRILHLVFIVEWKKLFHTLLSITIGFIIFANTFNNKMLEAELCSGRLGKTYENQTQVRIDNPNINQTISGCRERLGDHMQMVMYKAYQANSMLMAGFFVICFSTVVFQPMLKVFRNEHRNRWYSMGVFYWSSNIVRLIEMTIITLNFTSLFYFAVNHQIVDDNQFNIRRFLSFVTVFWIYFISLQSVGQFISIIFRKYVLLAIILSQMICLSFHVLDGYVFMTKYINNWFFLRIIDLVDLKNISHAMIYSLYGLDRCQNELIGKSLILIDYNIDTDTVYTNLWRVIFKFILLFRVASLFLMYGIYSWTYPSKRFIHSINQQVIPIDFDNDFNDNVFVKNYQRIKEDKELKFEEFSRGKIIVAWRSVTLFGTKSIYEIRSSHQLDDESKDLILRNVNGQFRFGTMNAIMGTSGAGKTSLLRVLFGLSKTRLSQESKFYVSKYTPIRTCYISQEVSGHLIPGLTAKQCLIYASKLKNINEKGYIDHENIAISILKELDIDNTCDTKVSQCSGGERKRLALALELTSLRMPNFILIDEPTSGLDSNSAEVVIGCLSELVRLHNITIITTIHQPNTEVLMMFDQVYVLAKGGVCIYSGHPNQMLDHLSEKRKEKDEGVFATEELIKHSCLSHKDGVVQRLVQSTTKKILSEDQCLKEETQMLVDGLPRNRVRFSFKSVWILMQRYIDYIKANCFWFLFFFLLPFIYEQIQINTFDEKTVYSNGCFNIEEDDIFGEELCNSLEGEKNDLVINSQFVSYAQNIFLIIIMMESAIMFYLQNNTFINEHHNGWYSTGSFYLSKSLTEFIPKIIQVIIYMYFIDMVHPVRPHIYYWMIPIMIFGVLSSQAIGQLISLMTAGDLVALSFCIPIVSVYWLIISGQITPMNQMPYLYRFTSIVNPMRYHNQAVIVMEYGFGRCSSKEVNIIMYMLGYDDHLFYYSYLMEIFIAFFYRIIVVLILWYKSNSSKNRRARCRKIINTHQQLINSKTEVLIPGLGCHQEFVIKSIQP